MKMVGPGAPSWLEVTSKLGKVGMVVGLGFCRQKYLKTVQAVPLEIVSCHDVGMETIEITVHIVHHVVK